MEKEPCPPWARAAWRKGDGNCSRMDRRLCGGRVHHRLCLETHLVSYWGEGKVMVITISLGWWIVPATITLATVIFALWPGKAPHGFGNLGDDYVAFALFIMGIIVSLSAWLIWSLLS